jgi:hypothetical protein
LNFICPVAWVQTASSALEQDTAKLLGFTGSDAFHLAVSSLEAKKSFKILFRLSLAISPFELQYFLS